MSEKKDTKLTRDEKVHLYNALIEDENVKLVFRFNDGMEKVKVIQKLEQQLQKKGE